MSLIQRRAWRASIRLVPCSYLYGMPVAPCFTWASSILAMLRWVWTLVMSFSIVIILQNFFVSFTFVTLLYNLIDRQAVRGLDTLVGQGLRLGGPVYATSPLCCMFSGHCIPWVAACSGAPFLSPPARSCGDSRAKYAFDWTIQYTQYDSGFPPSLIPAPTCTGIP